MTNRHASHLPIGARIRHKGGGDDAEVYLVERIELTHGDRKKDVLVHAGGHVFRAWEIERADPVQGWSKGQVS
jgi:hypothetical protein